MYQHANRTNILECNICIGHHKTKSLTLTKLIKNGTIHQAHSLNKCSSFYIFVITAVIGAKTHDISLTLIGLSIDFVTVFMMLPFFLKNVITEVSLNPYSEKPP